MSLAQILGSARIGKGAFRVENQEIDSVRARYLLGGTDFALKNGATLELPWGTRDVSAAGAPTLAYVTTVDGVFQILLDVGTSEVETAGIDYADLLAFDSQGQGVYDFFVKVTRGVGGFLSTDKIVIGLASAYNADFDAITNSLWFMAVLASGTAGSPGNWYVENDDGTHENDDVDTGYALTDAIWWGLRIDMSDPANCKFYISKRGAEVSASGNNPSTPSTTNTWKRVASGTTFNMTSAAAGLQPVVYVQRAASTRAHEVLVDAFQPTYVRRAGS